MSSQACRRPRRAAKRRDAFGGVQRYREECRDVRRVSWLEDLRTDVRFALRLARHHPGFSANVILISALGIAACVTTFSLVSGILLAPLPFPEQDRVFSLELNSAQGTTAAIPADTYLRLAAGTPVFDAVTATAPSGTTVEVNGEQVRKDLAQVTASFFNVYRIRPIIGRSFTANEVADRSPVVLLGYDEWMNHYGGDRDIVGRPVTFDGAPHTIIGVMPPRFLGNFEAYRFPPAMWVPYRVERSGAERQPDHAARRRRVQGTRRGVAGDRRPVEGAVVQEHGQPPGRARARSGNGDDLRRRQGSADDPPRRGGPRAGARRRQRRDDVPRPLRGATR